MSDLDYLIENFASKSVGGRKYMTVVNRDGSHRCYTRESRDGKWSGRDFGSHEEARAHGENFLSQSNESLVESVLNRLDEVSSKKLRAAFIKAKDQNSRVVAGSKEKLHDAGRFLRASDIAKKKEQQVSAPAKPADPFEPYITGFYGGPY